MTIVAEIIGYLAATLVFLTFYIKTMTPLRIIAICSNCAFLTYAYLNSLYPIFSLHIVLLPLNAMRLYEIVKLSRQVREAADGDLNMDWIKPYSTCQRIQFGELLFRKGEASSNMFVIASGRFRLEESKIELGAGTVVGELSLLAPDRRHTRTLRCVESGKVFRMSLEQVEQLVIQNQRFGLYFLKLISSRMSENREKLEHTLAEREQEIRYLRGEIAFSVDYETLADVG